MFCYLLFYSFNEFETHARVVVRALPEAGMIIFLVDVALRIAAPIPLAKLTVNEVVLDILPAVERLLQSSLITETLIDIVEANHDVLPAPTSGGCNEIT